ncbi:hypothetical protein L5515_018173 [Caenorhabditis briggsae]|uniref:Uncharacterized protein n=1 Tax=Caenorhabditis briggsae TaxID=6238 RepID=A0AAE9JS99_CAEBR|nr:hypothetical protein L5515_018173 [Caenorhabditis briggsae]
MTGKAKLVKKYEGYSRIALSKDKYEVEEDMEELRKMRAQNHMVDYSDVQYNHLEIKPRGAINIYGDLISPFDKLEYSQIPEHFFLLDHSGHSSINRNPTVPERWLSSQNEDALREKSLYAKEIHHLRITSIYSFSLFNGKPKHVIHRGCKDEVDTEFTNASRRCKLPGSTPLNKIFPRKKQGTPFGLSSEIIPVDARIPNHRKKTQ